MKKLLLASTALIGFAGAAAAEVVVEGYVEMGVTGGDLKETQFHNSYRLLFVMSGETDTGLSFGATYSREADNTSEENQDTTPDNGTVFISGAFGKLTLGDTDGALDWAMTEPALGTSLLDEHTTHIGYWGNGDGYYDDQVLRYEYAFGDFGFALSLEQDDGDANDDDITDTVGGDDVDTGDLMIGIGGKYATEYAGVQLGFGLGFQTGEGHLRRALYSDVADDYFGYDIFGELDSVGISASAKMDNGLSLILNYSTFDMDISYATVRDSDGLIIGAGDVDESLTLDHYGVGIGYQMGALLLAANWGKWEYDLPSALDGAGIEESYDSFSVLANYDLGGGAVLAAGYASDISYEDGDQNLYSLGMSLSF